jgi:glycosyltransferase involved in cell wall biosynthesis
MAAAVCPIPHSLPARRGAPEISVVVPLHDEQENLDELHRRLSAVLGSLRVSYEILLVDDGSRDATAERIGRLQEVDPAVQALHLSRNFGHQAAVSAGLDYARGRAVVVMDGDLQDPPELISRFVRLWRDGDEVVYAIRRRRREGPLKRLGYAAFYRLWRAVSEVDVPLDSGDFCLLDRRVVDALTALPERVRFVRGLRSFVGFRQAGVPYDRPARAAGASKYPLRSLVALAIDGLISFSGRPLRLVTYLGIASAAACAVLTAWALADALGSRSAPQGWASTLVVVLFMGSIQLISLGILGEYIRLIFLETKGRPAYVVARHRGEGAGPPRRRRRRAAAAGRDRRREFDDDGVAPARGEPASYDPAARGDEPAY